MIDCVGPGRLMNLWDLPMTVLLSSLICNKNLSAAFVGDEGKSNDRAAPYARCSGPLGPWFVRTGCPSFKAVTDVVPHRAWILPFLRLLYILESTLEMPARYFLVNIPIACTALTLTTRRLVLSVLASGFVGLSLWNFRSMPRRCLMHATGSQVCSS